MPAGFASPTLPQERPRPGGFVLVGATADGWTIEGDRAGRGPALAAAAIDAGGGTVALRWSRYAIEVRGPDTPRLRRQVLAVARGMSRG